MKHTAPQKHATKARTRRPTGEHYYRDQLSGLPRKLYDDFERQLLSSPESCTAFFPVKDPGEIENICDVCYESLTSDHPDFFFLKRSFTRCCRDDLAVMGLNSFICPEEYPMLRLQIKTMVKKLIRGTASLNTVEKEALVYHRITRYFRYVNDSSCCQQSALGPVMTGHGVCEGINDLFLLCLRAMGIPAIKVIGKIKGSDSGHCWTLVFLGNNEAAHCDPTFDLQDNAPAFNYFNLTDDQIREADHRFSSRGLPACTTEEYSYYNYFGCRFRTRHTLRRFLKDPKNSMRRKPVYFQAPFIKTIDQLLGLINCSLPPYYDNWTCRFNTTWRTAVLIPPPSPASSRSRENTGKDSCT